MRYKVLDVSPVEPVSLSDMRLQLGIMREDDNARDVAIATAISSAREWAESYTGVALIRQTRKSYADQFCTFFDLHGPLVGVNRVDYLDAEGVLQQLSVSDYLVDDVSHRLYPAYGITWPATRAQVNAVQIEYVTGYACPDVPLVVQRAIIIIVNHWEKYYQLSEGVSYIGDIPNAAKTQLNTLKDCRHLF